jgi:ankyrin repeat protein
MSEKARSAARELMNQLLHQLIESKDVKMIAILLDNGANVNSVNSRGETPLHLAVNLGYQDVVALLLERKADTTLTDHKGLTPLKSAEQDEDSNKETINLLKGIKTAADTSEKKVKPVTPLNLSLTLPKKDNPGSGQGESTSNPPPAPTTPRH